MRPETRFFVLISLVPLYISAAVYLDLAPQTILSSLLKLANANLRRIARPASSLAATNMGVKIIPRPSQERGHADHDWLKTFHTFSFASYYEPSHAQFGPLRVINEDRVAPRTGFGTHSHQEFEIFSYVVAGQLEHKDSMGNTEILKRGDLQLTSAGTGISHSEKAHGSKQVHFLQIWSLPSVSRLTPKYFTRHFTDAEKRDQWARVVAPVEAEGVVAEREAQGPAPVQSPLTLYATLLSDGKNLTSLVDSDNEEQQQNTFIPAPPSTQQTTMAAVAFRVPRPWDTNVPKFTTEDKDDLRDFLEQVAEIIRLGAITDEQEKKELVTSYLPMKKREAWRALTSYPATANKTYIEFKTDVLAMYPEVAEETDGTLAELETLCAANKGIRRSEEGKLKRFGIKYKALVQKLMLAPALASDALRMSVSTRVLWKEELAQVSAATNAAQTTATNAAAAAAAVAAGNPVPAPPAPPANANAGRDRKEDPIQLDELIELAEKLAHRAGSEAVWSDADLPDLKRTDKFPRVKIEERDMRLEELGGEVAGLRDAVVVVQKQARASEQQARASHEEIMKAVNSLRNAPPPPPTPNEFEQRSNAQNSYGQQRQYGNGGNAGYGGYGGGSGGGQRGNASSGGGGCFYCDGDHFARDCKRKTGHFEKQWIAVEDGKQKLGDGNPIPRGPGSVASRVEEYWQRKNAVGQNLVMEGAEDEVDVLRDEIRTLRARFVQIEQRVPAEQPAFMISAPNPPQQSIPVPVANQATPAPQWDMEAFGRAMFNAMSGRGEAPESMMQAKTSRSTNAGQSGF
ncbi:hypothetical protein HMN09_01349400 [Mycena chlorophos]|uniref:Pirin N-terminal domain-containing protein n=1 Tax=Mycena chlorophos TaxID=658473 RepID=A0A8H6S0G3_MYCCL|nr:hypothetical protein HMN09_01349400 [Mycena chlorophos]